MEPHIAWALTTLLIAFVGWFLAGYMKKKGENLATHEDIDKLVKQMAAVTQATKEIEAKISSDVWQRQKQWEVQKEAVFEALKELGTMQWSLGAVVHACARFQKNPESELYKENQTAAATEYKLACISLARAKTVAMLVCGKTVRDTFEKVERMTALTMNRVTEGHMADAFDEFSEFVVGINRLTSLMRTELHIEDTPVRPQSSGSSAAPNPAAQAPE